MSASYPQDLLASLLPQWHLLIQEWSASGRLTAAAHEALLLDGEPQALKEIVSQWSLRDFQAVPEIVLLSNTDINGALGAYAQSTGKIYLNADWLEKATQEAVNAVLTEELGHHLDGMLNPVDTLGDEGELFAELLITPSVTSSEQKKLRTQNDRTQAMVNGSWIKTEAANSTGSNLAIRLGGTLGDNGRGLASFIDGSSLITGVFNGTASFGGTTLTSSGSSDIFIAKVDANGNFLLVTRAGGTLGDSGNGIASLADGSSLITGVFNGTASFGGTTLTSFGSSDIFIAKVDANGNFLWATRAGGTTGGDQSMGIASLADGSSLTTGYFSGTASFGATTLTSSGSSDIFIAKVDAYGDFLWATRAGGLSTDIAYDITVLADGSSLITGDFLGAANFGTTTLTAAENQDSFTSKLDANGNFLWVAQNSGTGGDRSYSITKLVDGSSLIAGYFIGTASFGSSSLTSAGDSDAFIAKVDANGNFLWAIKAGGTSLDEARSITSLADGSSLVAGVFNGSAKFGSTTLTSAGSYDIFIAKVDANGNFLWATRAGGSSTDIAVRITARADGSSLISGNFAGTASFGSTTLQSAGGTDIFIAELNADGTWATDQGPGIVEGSIFDLITVSNNIGTAGNDSILITSPYVATWGKQGNDTFTSKSKQSPVFLVGGSGNDTYILDGLSSAVVAEYGTQDSSSDTIILRNIPNTMDPWYATIIDNRHLFVYVGGVADDNMDCFILDFFGNSSGIEFIDFQSGGGGLTGKYSADNLRNYIVSVGASRQSWTEADKYDLTGFVAKHSISASTINDTISLLKANPDTPIITSNIPLPIYSLTPSASSINEGGTLATSISTTGVTSGTTLYYGLSGTGITTADVSSGALTGQVTVGTNGSASFSYTLSNDLTTEAAETLQIKLFSDAARTLQVGSTASVSISDTSTAPGPIYSLTPSATSINEGATLTTSVSTTGVTSGTTLYYGLSGTGITAADFLSGELAGSGVVGTDGKFSFAYTVSNDLTTEGDETLQINLFSDAARTLQVGSSASVALIDSSIRYPLSLTAWTGNSQLPTTTVSENLGIINFVSSDLPAYNQQKYYWYLSGEGVNKDDFLNSGTFTSEIAFSGIVSRGGMISKPGPIVLSFQFIQDEKYENESITLSLFTDAQMINLAAAPLSILILDSPTYALKPSVSSVSEGLSLTTTVVTTNVASGTTLYWSIGGTGVTAADFSSGALTGSGMVGTDGKFSFAHTTANDLTTEGDETLQIKLFSDLAKTAQVGTTANVTLKDTSLTPVKPTQKVYTEKPQITYKPTSTVSAPLLYTTSSGDANLSGLTLDVHYNSSILTPTGANNGVSGQVSAAISSTAILADTNNTDGDPLTDKIIQLVWATFDSSFPNKTLPAPLATVSFNTTATKKDPLTGQPLTTTVRYTASETAAGYDFLTGFTTFKAQHSFNLDVDGDGKVTALGDGLMVIRKLFGAAFAGDALTYKAISPNATRTTAEVNDFIQQGIDGGMLDVDKDGKTTALGDGLMVIRRLFGAAFDGAALTNKAIGPNSPYFGLTSDFNSIGINVDALKLTFL